jgi:hypothetical protein
MSGVRVVMKVWSEQAQATSVLGSLVQPVLLSALMAGERAHDGRALSWAEARGAKTAAAKASLEYCIVTAVDGCEDGWAGDWMEQVTTVGGGWMVR